MANFTNIKQSDLSIPVSAYQPIKRCPNCQSVFINDHKCEACGRSLSFHPIGEAFGPKSFYSIKERYIESFDLLVSLYPLFEDKNSADAKSYLRNLTKRFTDLLEAFNHEGAISRQERRFFYIESRDLIDELLRYRVNAQSIEALLEQNDASIVGQELIYYLHSAKLEIGPEAHWWKLFNDFRYWGIVRNEFFLKCLLVSATVVSMAVYLKELISLQFGR